MDAATLPANPLRQKPEIHFTTYADVFVPANWCGTCQGCLDKSKR